MGKTYYVYILTGPSRVLYTGVTSNLEPRVWQHKEKRVKGFTSKYNLTHLVYFETGHSAQGAIAREKQIKGLLRRKKIALIESLNPHWRDLSADWFAKRVAAKD